MQEKIKELQKTIDIIQERRFQEKVEILNFLREKLGNQIESLIDEYTKQDAIKQWKKIAQKQEKQDIPTLIEILWNQMCGSNGFKFTMTEEKEKENGEYRMNVTHCPFVEVANKIQGNEWGYHLFCMSDFGITEGFNPNIEFSRTKTLMQGDNCCNHCYKMKSMK